MARRNLAGKSFFLYRGNDEASNETFDFVACIETQSITQSTNDLSSVTTCGVIHLAGTQDSSVAFSFIPLIEQTASEVGLAALQADFVDSVSHNWKITTTEAATGDPVWSFRGYLREFNQDFSASDFYKANGTIQVDGNGVTLTAVA